MILLVNKFLNNLIKNHLQIILNKSNKVILIRGGLTIIGQLTHMFFNCYCGQVVKSQSSSLINYM